MRLFPVFRIAMVVGLVGCSRTGLEEALPDPTRGGGGSRPGGGACCDGVTKTSDEITDPSIPRVIGVTPTSVEVPMVAGPFVFTDLYTESLFKMGLIQGSLCPSSQTPQVVPFVVLSNASPASQQLHGVKILVPPGWTACLLGGAGTYSGYRPV